MKVIVDLRVVPIGVGVMEEKVECVEDQLKEGT